ncbi:transmembrane protein [Ceratobasidium sp. AG-Ba]|nr:transmembrane protein [Ceratobasidium sp. AG-Ba]QRV91761.1 transmembrane protein [Ceratobasidium sp. AG-Ba]
MTAIALIIAAIIQNKTQNPQDLSLLDAIVVSMITTMMITFAISSSPTRSAVNKAQEEAHTESEEIDPNASFSRFLTQFAFVGLWAGWCFNLWQDPLHFGFKGVLPNCNVNENVYIVLFGQDIRATDERLRTAALVFISFGTLFAFGSLWISLETLLGPFVRLLRRGLDAATTRDPNKPPPEDIIMTCIRRGLQALSFATLIFLIVETEMTIKRNDTEHSSDQWSYEKNKKEEEEESSGKMQFPLPQYPPVPGNQPTTGPMSNSPVPPSPVPPSPSPAPSHTGVPGPNTAQAGTFTTKP